jgi:hypothetical protein
VAGRIALVFVSALSGAARFEGPASGQIVERLDRPTEKLSQPIGADAAAIGDVRQNMLAERRLAAGGQGSGDTDRQVGRD